MMSAEGNFAADGARENREKTRQIYGLAAKTGLIRA
jgi:hypothetical protein